MPHRLTLTGSVVRLEPLITAHASALVTAASGDRSSYGWTTVPETLDEAEAFIEAANAPGDSMPFAVRLLASDEIVGSTRFLGMQDWGSGPAVVEIGATWYSASTQGTKVNPECKLVMLAQAFDVWGVQRVQLKTDARNARSRAAIAKLGAQFEGILRNFQPGLGPDGRTTVTRDTAMYSILPAEWPAVRAGLEGRLARRDGIGTTQTS